MSKAGYSIVTAAAVALAAAGTAKTVLFAVAPSSFGIDLVKWSLELDGVNAAAVPVKWELCSLTAASNVTPGTGNTSATALQTYGRAIAVGVTGGYNCTSEPTVLAVIETGTLSPNGGILINPYSLGQSPDNDVSKGFAMRLTIPTGGPAVNAIAGFYFERC